jgi:hypothetical protein
MKAAIKKYRIKTTLEQKRWLLLLCFAITTLVVACDQQEEKKETDGSASTPGTTSTTSTASEPVKPKEQEIFDRSILVGDWIRTDAEYQITISELLDEGKLKASYFNPESINVDKARWIFADGAMKIYIELRDENYPGSNYNLIYYPDKDLLAGKYFQAVEGVTYDVEFFRKK